MTDTLNTVTRLINLPPGQLVAGGVLAGTSLAVGVFRFIWACRFGMATKTPRAFISHTTQNRAFVEKFAAALRTNGIDAWYAGWEIKLGGSFRARLDQGLADCETAFCDGRYPNTL